ncbi:MAG: DUF6644 family protein [Pseudomonadota bacterium]|nr:DUF6644 family protein [Pseudomonadota bacterium]
MQAVLLSLEHSWLAALVNDSGWLFPALEALHFIGLILLMGSLLVVDLRLMGVGAEAPLEAVTRFIPWSMLGFIVNLVSGVMFFASDPQNYYYNTAFRLKMLAVLLAGLNLIWFKRSVYPVIAASRGMNVELPASAAVIGGASLFLWLSVIVFGRLIPYLP